MTRVVNYRTDEGVKTALVNEVRGGGLHVLMLGTGQGGALTVETHKADEARYMTDLERAGKPYNLNRALAIFRRWARERGASKAAKRFIKEARA